MKRLVFFFNYFYFYSNFGDRGLNDVTVWHTNQDGGTLKTSVFNKHVFSGIWDRSSFYFSECRRTLWDEGSLAQLSWITERFLRAFSRVWLEPVVGKRRKEQEFRKEETGMSHPKSL